VDDILGFFPFTEATVKCVIPTCSVALFPSGFIIYTGSMSKNGQRFGQDQFFGLISSKLN
jgi:hypothetical protein